MARAGPAPAGESTVRTHNPATAPLIVSGDHLVGRAARPFGDLVHEVREHPPCAPEGGVEPRPQARQSAADTGKGSSDAPGRYRRADSERQAHDEARPPS